MGAVLRLLLDWWQLIRSPRAHSYLLITLLVDSAFAFVFLVAIQSYLPQQHGGSPGLPGYALAAFGAAKLAAQLLGGRIIDRVGARSGLLAGLILILIGHTALLAGSVTPRAALPGAAVYGLGGALIWPAIYAMASAAFGPSERGRLTSSIMLTTGIALGIGLGLGFVLPESFPYAVAIAVALVPIAGALVLALSSGSPEESSPLPSQAGAGVSLGGVMRDILRLQRLGFAVVMLLQSAALGALLAVFRSYGRELLGASFREELLLMAPAAVFGAGAVVAGGVFADRLGRAPLLAAGFLTGALAIWFLATVEDRTVAVALMTVAGTGLGLALPSVGAMSMDLSRTAATGTLLAWFMSIEGLGHAGGPAVGAWLDARGDTAAVFQMVAVLFGVAGVASLALLAFASASRAGKSEPAVAHSGSDS